MTESAHNKGSAIKDDGARLKFRNKGIRLEGSSRFAPRAPQFFDHFTGGFDSAATGTQYKVTVNSSTGTGTVAVVASAPGGVLRLHTAAASDAGIGYAAIATLGLVYEPDKLTTTEEITFEARVRTPTGTTLDSVWGLHDVATEATNPYVVDSTSTITTSLPTDFAGFTYSSTPTSGVLNISGTTTNYFGIINSCANTDVIASTGVANDLKFHIFRVTVNSAGDVTYYIDDVQVYKQLYVASTTGLTPTVPLCASASVADVGQTAVGLDLDYFSIGGALDLTA